MWQPIDASIFGEFKPVTTYLYYDGPRSFTVEHNGKKFYIHQCDEEIGCWTYWAQEVTDQDLRLLENNNITLKNFILSAKPLYVIKEYGGKPLEAFIVNANDFSDAHFPNEGVYLNQQSEKQGEDAIV